jgi:hypothetical protein
MGDGEGHDRSSIVRLPLANPFDVAAGRSEQRPCRREISKLQVRERRLQAPSRTLHLSFVPSDLHDRLHLSRPL